MSVVSFFQKCVIIIISLKSYYFRCILQESTWIYNVSSTVKANSDQSMFIFKESLIDFRDNRGA